MTTEAGLIRSRRAQLVLALVVILAFAVVLFAFGSDGRDQAGAVELEGEPPPSVTFEYFDDGNPNSVIAAPVASANLGNIRRITVAIVTGATVVGEQSSFPLIADVRLRN